MPWPASSFSLVRSVDGTLWVGLFSTGQTLNPSRKIKMDRLLRRSPAPVEAVGRGSGVTERRRIIYSRGHVANQIAATEPAHGSAFQLFSILYEGQSCRRELFWAACPLNLDAHVAESSSQLDFCAAAH